MRKVLFTLALFSVGLSWGQRQMDFATTITSPANNAEVLLDEMVYFNLEIVNNGSVNFLASDTLNIYVTINGQPIIFQPDNIDHLIRTGNVINAGATYSMAMPTAFSTGYENTTNEICFFVAPVNAADEIQELTINDNSDCIYVSVVEDNVALNENIAGEIAILPNPASESFSMDGLENNATILITDLNGKRMTLEVNSNNVDCSSWPNGVYLIQIHQNDTFIMKRLVVNH